MKDISNLSKEQYTPKKDKNDDIPEIVLVKTEIENYKNTFQNHRKILRISTKKPDSYKPMFAKLIRTNYKFVPDSMVVNILYSKPQSLEKDCCHKCKLIFNKTLDYLNHKYQNHMKSKTVLRNKYQICRQCGKTQRSKKALYNHQFVCFARLNKYYECSGCSQGFYDYKKMKIHRFSCLVPQNINFNTEKKERRFSCDLCEKKFSRKGGLTQHKNSFHFNIKPYVCTVCGHKYALKGDLSRCRHKRALAKGFVQN